MNLEEAIKVIEGRFEIMGYCENARLEEALDLAIESLKQSQSQWIPCSVRLPGKRGDYLVSLVRGLVTTQLYDNGFDADRKPGHHHPKNKVIAWMPKPKPYQSESEE